MRTAASSPAAATTGPAPAAGSIGAAGGPASARRAVPRAALRLRVDGNFNFVRLAIVGLSAIGMYHRKRLGHRACQPRVSAEIERTQRADRRPRNQLLLPLATLHAAAAL